MSGRTPARRERGDHNPENRKRQNNSTGSPRGVSQPGGHETRKPGAVPMQNWSRQHSWQPRDVAAPSSEEDVAALLAGATSAGERVRAVGAAHSFTPLAATDGIGLSLDRLSGVVRADLATGEVTFRAGTRLFDAPSLLDPYGLALANMGDIDRQSIAGAVSTATHGTGLAFTGYPGMVTGLRVALADGRIVDCSPDVEPELFEAARVGLGAIGVLLRVTVQCVPTFALEARETTEALDAVVESFVERARSADHLEYFWFPGTTRVTVKVNRRLEPGAAVRPMTAADRMINRELVGNGLFGGLCRAGARVPGIARATASLGSRLMAGGTYSDASHRVYVAPRRIRFNETEFAFPLEAWPEVFREVGRAIARTGEAVSFPLEVRTAHGDDTWLGTSSGHDSVYLAVHRYWREDWRPLFRPVWDVFRAYGGRPHWGKMHESDAEELAGLYPRFSDFTRVRRAVDPSGTLLNEHLAGMVR